VENKEKKHLIKKLTEAIDDWITNGAHLTRQKTLKFGNHAQKKEYGELIGKLDSGGSDWGDARRALIGRIGQYCAYCDSPIFSHLHIEHILPKSTFPENIFAWPNFLLACASCNSAKSNQPNQGTIPGAPKSTSDASEYITNVNGINYLWPSMDWSRLGYRRVFPFRYVLAWMEPYFNRLGFADEIGRSDAEDLTNRFFTGTLPQERGLYFDTASGGKRYFGVQVKAVSAPFVPSSASEAVIEAASLNNILDADASAQSVDRRILNRTTAWFRASILRRTLNTAFRDDDNALRTAVINIARIAIRNTGFWPIWLQVLGNLRFGGETAQEYLQNIFPGTTSITWQLPI
jgi:hypothetical protein